MTQSGCTGTFGQVKLLDCPNAVCSDAGIAPVMFVTGAVLFPKCTIPIRIFEPRYISMLQNALESTRAFILSFEKEENFSSGVGTMGLIKSSARQPDGTSILFLEGLFKVNVTGKSLSDVQYPLYHYHKKNYSNESTDKALIGQLKVKYKELIKKFEDIDFPKSLNFDDASNDCERLLDIFVQNLESKKVIFELDGAKNRISMALAILESILNNKD